METLLLTMIVFALATAGLSINVIINNKPMRKRCAMDGIDDTCIKDRHGNKIARCSSCDCEDDPLYQRII